MPTKDQPLPNKSCQPLSCEHTGAPFRPALLVLRQVAKAGRRFPMSRYTTVGAEGDRLWR